MKTIAFVPAKGKSERIENKNKQILDGEYLFKRKLRQLLDCKEIDEVWLDSEDKDIHELAQDLPIKHHYRDPALADNNTDGHQMFANESKITSADIIVQVLCTAPFVDKNVIDPALKKLKASDKTSLVAVTEQKLYLWEDGKPLYGEKIPNSVDLPTHIIESMSFYAVKTKQQAVDKRYTNDAILYPLKTIESVDINNNDDLKLAQTICAGQRAKRIQQLKILSKSISSCLISDVCKEHGVKHFLSKDIKLLNTGSFLGYAKTLKLKKLDQPKEWEGIFDALGSYSFVEPGDVIVVSTDVQDKAYFGELNAHFAYRNGAVGVVSVASHVVGNEISQMISLIHSGDIDQAEEINTSLQEFFSLIFEEPSPGPIKDILSQTWEDVGMPLLPITSISDDLSLKLLDNYKKIQ